MMMPADKPVLDIAPAAADATKVVESFLAALSAGNLPAAEALLDANVTILENGDAERSRAEYMGGHAKGDAAFLKNVHQQLKRRTAQADGNTAWVLSESVMHLTKDGKMTMLLNTETMLLRKSSQGWRIVHIHWSSRAMKPAQSN
ncbi:hypothetical protein N789_12615 [Arenimonas oryziterrae DSM 21050 = YC6267]|uniref:SnoaL-like domain-containing protein n=2 Tax=Arenimonas TaxID=490567 RepID=A0A091BF32_9GAMM|nr:hypothetical protein N789_12615 [Arenimonas oryziterrae DSM 21050 = YC6267]